MLIEVLNSVCYIHGNEYAPNFTCNMK